MEDGCVKGVFRLCDSEETRKTWNDNKFELLYSITLCPTELWFELAVTNKGNVCVLSMHATMYQCTGCVCGLYVHMYVHRVPFKGDSP